MKIKDALLLNLNDDLLNFLSKHEPDNFVALSTKGEVIVCENNDHNRFLLEPESFSDEDYFKIYEERFGEIVWHSPVGYKQSTIISSQ